ncbi:MAG: hypothetical protein AAFW81_04505 [Pseudomonadota bacterium]
MTYVNGVTMQGLGDGGGFALWSFRAIASGCGGCAVLQRGFGTIFGEDGPLAFEEIRRFTRVLGNAGRRRLLLAEAGCCGVTADELSVVATLAAAQADDYVACKAHLSWLMGGRNEDAGVLAASRAAAVFTQHGWLIAPPAIEITIRDKRVTGPVSDITGHA